MENKFESYSVVKSMLNVLDDNMYNVVNDTTNEIIFIGTMEECKSKIIYHGIDMVKLIDKVNYLEKKLRDTLNWVKSDLATEETPKLAKTMTPYRSEKLRFLRQIEKILSNN